MKSTFIKSLQFLIFSFLFLSALTSAAELFPKPAELEPDVNFWVRVYTEVDTKSGFIHDPVNLAVVYETVRLKGSPSADRRHIKVTKAKYAKILRRLASGKRSGLNAEEQRVLSLWGRNVGNTRLQQAAGDIRFQLGQSNRFREGLVRAGEWSQYIRKTLTDRKLPQELAVLPHVESSFNPNAYSSVGAAGIWQFTRSTGRRYLDIDYVVDERMDPFKATVAAAQLLEHNYNVAGTWPLAITAYNHGLAGMRRAVRKLGTSDIATVVRKYKGRTFGFASRNFYVAYLAALEVDSNPLKYFPPYKSAQPVDYDIIEMSEYMHVDTLRRAFNIDLATLKQHNRALLPPVWNGDKRIPKGFKMKFPRDRLKQSAAELLAAIPANERFSEQTPDLFHKVVRGDTVSEIAARYGYSIRQVMALNGLRNHRIRIGQELRLPAPANMNVNPVQPGTLVASHQVVRGDTVSGIAARYGYNVGEVMALNDLKNSDTIRVGQVLRLPVAAGTSAPDTRVTSHTVARGDTVSGIAARYGYGVQEVLALNGLNKGDTIRVGQELRLPTPENVPAQEAKPAVILASLSDSADFSGAAPETHKVTRGDTVSGIAARYGYSVQEIMALNGLNNSDTIRIGQELRLPVPASAELVQPDAVAEAEPAAAVEAEPEPAELAAALPEEAEQAAGEDSELEPEAGSPLVAKTEATALLEDPSDYTVEDDNTIEVQAAETLGHYAEWLDLRASNLRRINGMRYGKPLVIGHRLKLDFSRVSKKEFERRRMAYQKTLQEAFFATYQIGSTNTHVVSRGESLWELSLRDFKVPIWLLRQYNPDLDLHNVRPGTVIVIPELVET